MDGLIASRLDYLAQMWKLRYFWMSLVHNDLSARYKRSFFGIGWSLVRPLGVTLVYSMVFAKLFKATMADYIPYLLVGTTTWQFITESLNQGCFSFARGAPYIKLQQIPLAIFPLRTVVGAAFHFLVALAVAVAGAAVFRGLPNPAALIWLIPALAVLFVLGWLFAIISGVIHTHFPDTCHLMDIGLQLLFFMTPILFTPESVADRGRMSLVFAWNPFTAILGLIRTPILEGTAPSTDHILISLLFVSLVGALAVFLLRKLERTLVFWI